MNHCKRFKKDYNGIALVVACAFLCPTANAQLSNDDVRGFAACQAWSSAVLKTPESFSEEWQAWAMGVMATAIASPMNDDWSPFKDDPRFVEHLRNHRAEFAKEPASVTSPSFVRAHMICMDLVNALERRRK